MKHNDAFDLNTGKWVPSIFEKKENSLIRPKVSGSFQCMYEYDAWLFRGERLAHKRQTEEKKRGCKE